MNTIKLDKYLRVIVTPEECLAAHLLIEHQSLLSLLAAPSPSRRDDSQPSVLSRSIRASALVTGVADTISARQTAFFKAMRSISMVT